VEVKLDLVSARVRTYQHAAKFGLVTDARAFVIAEFVDMNRGSGFEHESHAGATPSTATPHGLDPLCQDPRHPRLNGVSRSLLLRPRRSKDAGLVPAMVVAESEAMPAEANSPGLRRRPV
jgi:hypothetical protein